MVWKWSKEKKAAKKLIVGDWPANPGIGVRIYSRQLIPVMVALATTGEMSVKEAMNRCAKELEMVIDWAPLPRTTEEPLCRQSPHW